MQLAGAFENALTDAGIYLENARHVYKSVREL